LKLIFESEKSILLKTVLAMAYVKQTKSTAAVLQLIMYAGFQFDKMNLTRNCSFYFKFK